MLFNVFHEFYQFYLFYLFPEKIEKIELCHLGGPAWCSHPVESLWRIPPGIPPEDSPPGLPQRNPPEDSPRGSPQRIPLKDSPGGLPQRTPLEVPRHPADPHNQAINHIHSIIREKAQPYADPSAPPPHQPKPLYPLHRAMAEPTTTTTTTR